MRGSTLCPYGVEMGGLVRSLMKRRDDLWRLCQEQQQFDRRDILTTTDVQVIIRNLAITRGHFDVEGGVRRSSVEVVLDDGAVLYRRKAK